MRIFAGEAIPCKARSRPLMTSLLHKDQSITCANAHSLSCPLTLLDTINPTNCAKSSMKSTLEGISSGTLNSLRILRLRPRIGDLYIFETHVQPLWESQHLDSWHKVIRRRKFSSIYGICNNVSARVSARQKFATASIVPVWTTYFHIFGTANK